MGEVFVAYSDKLKTALEMALQERSTSSMPTKRPGRSIEDDAAVPDSSSCVLAKIQSGNGGTYIIELFEDGLENKSTGTAAGFVPDIALGSVLPAGTVVVAHPHLLNIIGGND